MDNQLTWYSPDERMPTSDDTDAGGFVLVAFGGKKDPVIRCGRWDGELWHNMSLVQIHRPHAWAPMPAPPKFADKGDTNE